MWSIQVDLKCLMLFRKLITNYKSAHSGENGSGPVSPMATSPSQVPLHNRYNGLQVEPNNDKNDGSSRLEASPRLSRPMHCVKTTSIKKEKR